MPTSLALIDCCKRTCSGFVKSEPLYEDEAESREGDENEEDEWLWTDFPCENLDYGSFKAALREECHRLGIYRAEQEKYIAEPPLEAHRDLSYGGIRVIHYDLTDRLVSSLWRFQRKQILNLIKYVIGIRKWPGGLSHASTWKSAILSIALINTGLLFIYFTR